MKTLKVVALSTLTIVSLGGGYGLSKLIIPQNIEEEKVTLESVWILEGGKKRICNLVDVDKKEWTNLGIDGQPTRSCFTSWSKNLPKKSDKLNSEWWIRGKEKNSLNAFLENEPQLSEDMENYLRKENSSAKINLELLRSKCDISGEDKVEYWIVIGCPLVTKK